MSAKSKALGERIGKHMLASMDEASKRGFPKNRKKTRKIIGHDGPYAITK